MLILGIDTSTENCSVGLVKDGKIVSDNSILGKFAHAERIVELVNKAFSMGYSLNDLDAIAISIGPGSYTGLRVGLGFAKGMSLALGIPILPVPTIAVLDSVVRDKYPGEKILFIRSHKDIVYYVLANSEDSLWGKPHVESIVEVVKKYKHVESFVGNFDFELDTKAIEVRYPSGVHAALLGYKHYSRLIKMSNPELEPYYLTEFKADRWKKR
ncbi:MAG: tRNA (adenosine(37)-N6)-threonylcarbamoyltransferase complex dimerization subunit type 1 TsaB [Candidatus Marinimicrobia bacterium]|nr:tRNA (adenosine(37)-N6)-threonylcarbamoyltransferase complex dimerization subunit type 1 TsaB [Candidatus Neomarinimicrobiota bacterium]